MPQLQLHDPWRFSGLILERILEFNPYGASNNPSTLTKGIASMKFNRAQIDNLLIQLQDASDELRRRLFARQSCSAEELLCAYPRLHDDADLAVRLIHAEWAARVELGDNPSVSQWLERFPQWRDRLERRFREDSLLGASLLENTPTVALDREGDMGLLATAPARSTGGEVPPGEVPLPLDIHQEIGRGAMGVVYLAWDRMLDRSVALKKMRADLLDHPDAVYRFYHEARAAARLNHPNIIAIHGMGRVGEQHGFTMPLAKANLDQQRAHYADARAATALLTKIARAVHAAHQHGLVHRDLKPANILLDERDEPLIADFGLAVLLTDVHPTVEGREIVGTPHYMAPEQFGAFDGRVTEATDVWALGVILYELLAGQRPFQARTMSHLRTAIHQAEPPPLPLKPRGVDRGLDAIVHRCLEKNPQQRYASAEALAQDLDNWREGKPLQAKPDRWFKRTWRQVRRRPALSTAVALMLLFGVIVTVQFAAAPAPTPAPIPTPPTTPAPEDPDVVALRSIETQLKNGEPVEFVTPEGHLLRQRWIQGSGGVDVNEKKEGVDIHSLSGPALVELLPHVPLDRYELRVEAMQWPITIAQQGIYALHHVEAGRGVAAHSFLSFAFSENAPWPRYLFAELTYRDKTTATEQIAQTTFPAKLGPWHVLRVQVTPDDVRVLHGDDGLRKLLPADLEAAAGRIRKGRELGKGEPANPMFDNHGGVGLYLLIGKATYRRITLKPLP
jgi:serine/threonine protein kinase